MEDRIMGTGHTDILKRYNKCLSKSDKERGGRIGHKEQMKK